MTADGFCLVCGRPLAFYNDGGWKHTRGGDGHKGRPDRGVAKPTKKAKR